MDDAIPSARNDGTSKPNGKRRIHGAEQKWHASVEPDACREGFEVRDEAGDMKRPHSLSEALELKRCVGKSVICVTQTDS